MPKGKKLVIGHLEKISGKVMEDYRPLIQSLIRGKSGVYALYHNDALYYVGLASNLMNRLNSHLKDRHSGKWNRFSVFLTVHDSHMKELESLVLRIVSPRGNRVGGKFVESENLSRVLNREMKDNDKDKRARLLGGDVKKRRVRSKTAEATGSHGLKDAFDRRVTLKGWHKGFEYNASLRRDGRISFSGETYKSPSAAGVAARGRSTNGWTFWHYRLKNEWVKLSTLRK